MERKMTTIPPTREILPKKPRVAAYARVSSGKDAMLHSLATQVSYYKNKITNNPQWEFAGVYADEAVTGTRQDRPEFVRLMADCRAGKIDMVITKSISRFARNTVTTLANIRELKEMGIAVQFDKENINTMTGDGELMLTVLSAFAQEESFNVSENCKWRIKQKYAKGEMTGLPYILGYDVIDGALQINPEEAEIVRMIFTDYLSGMGLQRIRDKLTEMGVPTHKGQPWRENAIKYILQNEKYAGDLVLQKTFTPDHISKKKYVNKGQLPKVVVEENHPPIVSRAVFLAVQDEIKRRAERYGGAKPPVERPPESYAFTGEIRCGGCGGSFRRRTTHPGGKYYKVFWQCDTYLRHGKDKCMARQIPEQLLIDIVSRLDKEPTAITAIYPTTLRFTFADGAEQEIVWQAESRKWTEDMKARNYERLRIPHKERINHAN